MSFQVDVITPEKVFWSDTFEQVVLPSITGDFGVLDNHAPLVSVLDVGVMKVRNGNNWVPLVLFGGFADIENNKLTILGNDAEEVSLDLLKEEAEEALNKVSKAFEDIKIVSKIPDEVNSALIEVKSAKARVAALNLI